MPSRNMKNKQGTHKRPKLIKGEIQIFEGR